MKYRKYPSRIILISIDQVQLSKTDNVDSGTFFKVYCPGHYKSFPHKLTMYNNGSVSNKVRYQDICTDRFVANFAWVWSREIEVFNNSMVKKPPQSKLCSRLKP